MSEKDQLVARYAARAVAKRAEVVAALQRPGEHERVLFETCIRPNVETAFGREHGFASIRTVAEYRAAVPIRNYDALAPWIERAAAGEPHVLTRDPILAFFHTSGTTGNSKKIPLTQRRHETSDLVRRYAICAAMYDDLPDLAVRADSAIDFSWAARAPESATSASIPVRSMTEHMSHVTELLGGPGTLAPWAQLPAHVRSDEEKHYFRMRMAVEHDVQCMMALNPSTLVVAASVLASEGARLERELRSGDVCGVAMRPPAPQRADELAALLREGPLLPRDVWPGLRELVCWKSAACALYLPRLRELYGDIRVRPFYISSSEGTITLMVDDHEAAGPVALSVAFFEFVPADAELEPHGHTLMPEELRDGHEYQVVMTQVNGMYRYAIGDVVRVSGFLGNVPRLEFVRRTGAVSSFTGEKLTEPQIVAAAKAALAQTSLAVSYVTCSAVWGDPPRYVWAIEPKTPLSEDEQRRLAVALEEALRECNAEYPGKRDSGRLAPCELVCLAPGTARHDRELRIAAGASPVQLKDPALHRDRAALDRLLSVSTQLTAPSQHPRTP